jgi:hypothetical protein
VPVEATEAGGLGSASGTTSPAVTLQNLSRRSRVQVGVGVGVFRYGWVGGCVLEGQRRCVCVHAHACVPVCVCVRVRVCVSRECSSCVQSLLSHRVASKEDTFASPRAFLLPSSH